MAEDTTPVKRTGEGVRAVIFDMDNTLFDLIGAKMAACDTTSGYLERDDGQELFAYFLRPDWGFEDWRNIRDYLLDRDIFTIPRYFEVCSLYEQEKLNHITAYPGVREVVLEIRQKGVPLALVTDADMSHARRRLEKAGLSGAFDHIVTYEMTGRKKPDTAPFLLALRKLGSESAATAMIGDSPHRDLAPAREVGMQTFYARYGDRLANTRCEVPAEFTLNSILDLPGLLYPLFQQPC
ncbi:MAG: HAD family hydrolase [Methanomicrobiales archaeon]